MNDAGKAALGSAVIVAAGIYFGATALAAPRFAIVGGATVVWRLDRATGQVSFCTSLGCQPVQNIAADSAQTTPEKSWSEQFLENHPSPAGSNSN